MAEHWLVQGDCRVELLRAPENSIDACVTDPPYELGFMGKAWDRSGVANDPATWEAVLRVLKPGGYLLAFGGTRTHHRMVCAIEDAGFEIRDEIQWLYGSVFPKSHNGPWGGTALKPACEPICVARKPLIGTVAANVLEHGTGALNIDGCRIATDDALGGGSSTRGQQMSGGWRRPWMDDPAAVAANAARSRDSVAKSEALGRWPANVILDPEAAAILDEQSGTLQSGDPGSSIVGPDRQRNCYGKFGGGIPLTGYGDTGGASRFFYCAKPGKKERGEGNSHPTVKPIALLRYLVRLVTPPGGTVLDPFAGSGTTLLAALQEGFDCIGIELNEEYIEISKRRLSGTRFAKKAG